MSFLVRIADIGPLKMLRRAGTTCPGKHNILLSGAETTAVGRPMHFTPGGDLSEINAFRQRQGIVKVDT